MSSAFHGAQTANHILENWTFADATARAAGTGYTIVSADIGKVAFQTDTGAYWRLTAVGGLAWEQISGTVGNQNGQIATQGLLITDQVGTTYSLLLTDANTRIRLNNASAITVTVPAHASEAFSVGDMIEFMQKGAGKPTLSPAGGVTINSAGSLLGISAQWCSVFLVNEGVDLWTLSGSLG